MIICPDNISHATDIRMVQKAHNGTLSCSSDLLGMVGSLAIGLAMVLVGRLSRYYFDGNLVGVVSGFWDMMFLVRSSRAALPHP